MFITDEILSMWKEDCVIDDHMLDQAAMDGARLHAKYLEMYSVNKMQLKKAEFDFKTLLKAKWLWYNGKMTKEDMDENGWEYDPFHGGVKPLKGDMDYYYDADVDIQKAQGKIELLKINQETLKEIMDNIRWRHQNIKNAIEWRKFTSGI